MVNKDNMIETATNTPKVGNYNSIPLVDLKRFPNHPFKDYKGEKFELLVESINTSGLIHPISVRPSNGNDFEILSGHNRVAAVKQLG